jgi:dTDP-4-dehydrorhamnose reductase
MIAAKGFYGMRVLVTGANGQLGRELQRVSWGGANAQNHKLEPVFATRSACDLADSAALYAYLTAIKPEFIINGAAYTAVDRAESDPKAAFAINAHAAGIIAAWAAEHNAQLLHISTDYVFDGQSPRPYVENDPVHPTGIYGASKEAGERLVRERLAAHIILRTAWVYSPYGHNFVKTMLRLMRERGAVKVVSDQRGSPTAAADLAQACVAIVASCAAGRAVYGTYHYTGAGEASWFSFASAIADLYSPALGHRAQTLPISTGDYPTPARRPAYSVLDCQKIYKDYAISQRPWQQALSECLQELLE